ncbi:hypothetical protein Pan14r_16390 [Crateriforma conspicua]|uniref:Uncharacterized protein n=1 Tax=Crateriforma conspicua TaxID=2527996 RepID=A0A5C5Y3P8_9PLAN|nr:hypothetical protein Pan14r_16390 [Crateriforma conspicua]
MNATDPMSWETLEWLDMLYRHASDDAGKEDTPTEEQR